MQNFNMIQAVWFVTGLVVGLTGCFDNGTKPTSEKADNPPVTEVNANKPVNTNQDKQDKQDKQSATNPSTQRCHNPAIYQAYQAQNPNQKIQVLGCGQVIKTLKDDNDGSRHQKILVRLDGYPQITILIAHNIDLAPRLDKLKAQTPIQFYGEYIYNDKGGVVHWTHKDPAARHQDGWLDYQGQRYW